MELIEVADLRVGMTVLTSAGKEVKVLRIIKGAKGRTHLVTSVRSMTLRTKAMITRGEGQVR